MPTACKVTADTNRVSVFISPELGCWGDNPGVGDLAPKAYETRMTGESLVHRKQTIVSNTIRQDRMRDTISEVAASAEGNLNFELAFRDLELLLEGAFAGDYSYLLERTITAGTVNAVAATDRFQVTSGAVDFDNFVVGADVWVGGFETASRNNGRFKVASIVAGGAYIGVDTETAGVHLKDETPTSGPAQTFKTPKGMFTDLEISANNTVISTTTNFLTSVNLALDQWIRMTGWSAANNNGVFRITGIAANTLTLDTTALTPETGPGIVLTAQRLRNGISRKSFLLEKKFADINQFVHFVGMRVGGMTMNTQAQQLVTGDFSFMGKEAITTDVTALGQIVEAGVSPAMNATTNVGTIRENGVAMTTAIQGLNLTLGNNLRMKPQIGSRGPVDIGYGFVDVTGTVTVYFESNDQYTKFINHEESALSFRFTDADGNVFVFNIPRLFYTDGNPNAGGGNADVLLGLNFTAVRDLDTDAVIVLDLLAA